MKHGLHRSNQNVRPFSIFRFALIGCGLAALHGAVSPGIVRADSVNSPNIAMNVDTNRSAGPGAGNVSVAVNTITVAETQLPEYTAGVGRAVTLRARPGFRFDPASPVTAASATIGLNGSAVNVPASLTPAGVADETLSWTLTSGTNANVQDIIRINGIRILIGSAAGAAGPAQTTLNFTTSTAGGAFTDLGIVAATIARGLPDRLVFSVQPGTSQAGGDLLPVVTVVDFGGNIVTADPRTISLSLQSNPGGATLLGTAQRSTVNGVATWVDSDDLRITVAASGYTLRASHSGAPFLSSDTADSSPFDIVSGTPGRLVITRQPSNTEAGKDILIDVTALDQFNNPITATSVNVTVSSAVNPGGWPLLVDTSLTKATINGVASWSAADHLRINKQLTGYRLAASGVGSPAFSDLFDVAPAAPGGLRFVTQPTGTQANVAMSPPVSVEILDAFGNRTSAAIPVAVSLLTAPCGGAVANAQTVSVGGLATFGTLEFDTPCTGNVLQASAAGLPGTASEPFDIAPPPVSPPAGGVCGAGIATTLAPVMLTLMLVRRRLR